VPLNRDTVLTARPELDVRGLEPWDRTESVSRMCGRMALHFEGRAASRTALMAEWVSEIILPAIRESPPSSCLFHSGVTIAYHDPVGTEWMSSRDTRQPVAGNVRELCERKEALRGLANRRRRAARCRHSHNAAETRVPRITIQWPVERIDLSAGTGPSSCLPLVYVLAYDT